MIVVLVHVRVKPEHIEDFKKACEHNHQGSIREPGNLRFDILQSADDPCRFVLYEAYRDEAAAAAHKDTPHYTLWRDTVKDWMAEPRQGVKYRLLYPDEQNIN